MRVLSFDVGTKNLAVCDLDYSVKMDDVPSGVPVSGVPGGAKYSVPLWSVLSCVPKDLNVNETGLAELVPYFIELVNQNVEAWSAVDYDYILIENQPMGGRGSARNLKTKVLSHILQAALLTKKKQNIQFVHPGLKLKDMVRTDGKTSYRANKAYAIEKTTECLATECRNAEVCMALMASKKVKKDDLADAFLQAKVFCESVMNGSLVIEKPEIKPKVEKTRVKKLKTETKTDTKSETKSDVKSADIVLDSVPAAKTKKAKAKSASAVLDAEAVPSAVVPSAVPSAAVPSAAVPKDAAVPSDAVPSDAAVPSPAVKSPKRKRPE